MNNGYIRLYRKLRQEWFYKKPKILQLFIHLLLSANHEKKEFMWNDNLIMVKEGQIITGRKQLSEETGLAETTIERILQMLESGHQIGQQKTTKYRLITILKWKDYQNGDTKVDNKRTTNGHKQELKELKEEELPSPTASASPFQGNPEELERELIQEEEFVSTKKLARKEMIRAKGYDPANTNIILKWAEERMEQKFPNPKKQMTAISALLASKRSPEQIKQTWHDMENDEWWGEKGFDFTNVLNFMSKNKGHKKPKGAISAWE